MKLFRPIIAGLATLATLVAAVQPARASMEYQFVPIWQSAPAPSPQGDRLQLDIHFAVENVHNERVLRGREPGRIDFVETAEAVVDGFDPVDARVGEPRTPLKVVLLIDKSGSMRSKVRDNEGNLIPNSASLDPGEPHLIRMDLVKDAARQAVEQAPADTEFSVIAFAEAPESITAGFISKSDGLNTIQDRLLRGFFPNPADTGNTCIYDALDYVIGELKQEAARDAASRFAIILFTDGKDAEAGPCRTRYTADSIVDFVREFRSVSMASPRPFPIYPIAPCIVVDGGSDSQGGDSQCGNIDDKNLHDLARLAAGTNAEFETGNLESIAGRFEEVMQILSSQWGIAAELPARLGWNTVKFTLAVQGSDEPFVVSATFWADRAWGVTPTVEIVGLDPNPDEMRYEARLKITHPEELAPFFLELWDAKTGGTTRREHAHEVQPAAEVTVLLPIKHLKLGEEYWIRLRSQQRIALLSNGVPIDAYSFRPVAQLRLEITAVERDPYRATDQLALTVKPVGFAERDWSELVEAVVITPEGGEAIAHLRQSFEVTATNTLLVRLDDRVLTATNGVRYMVGLRLKGDPAGISVTPREDVAIAPRPPVSFLKRVRAAVANVYVQLSVAAVATLVLAWLLVNQAARLRVAEPRPPSDHTRIAVEPTPPMGAPPEEPTVVQAPREAHRVTVRITRTNDPAQCRAETLARLPITIGRSSTADLTIGGDPMLGRHHATLKAAADGLLLEDMRTTNGTWVDGAWLEPGGSALVSGITIVQLGPNTSLELEVSDM